ncbi:TIGR02530 family flagellar biosynthesis protein [Amphibacillus cookii]|uniref:TIGR02530 family flagellar biosynthesis protein n=1 Tax=Amphibacillus cookii TaxID=767787 RepID=UPI0019582F53|nr:TIGR02530 family flagellar biosynthesis protein [Amphibacillus cookii]MBM7540576.1 flagellar operon protein [Amphibacillus cookii]
MDHRIQHIPSQALLSNTRSQHIKQTAQGDSFKALFNQAQSTLKISKHAQERLNERDIDISDAKWQEIANQVSEAKSKGITDSLVITEEATLLVSAKNNTVVTAMNRSEAQSRIFNNINGTIILD